MNNNRNKTKEGERGRENKANKKVTIKSIKDKVRAAPKKLFFQLSYKQILGQAFFSLSLTFPSPQNLATRRRREKTKTQSKKRNLRESRTEEEKTKDDKTHVVDISWHLSRFGKHRFIGIRKVKHQS